MLVCQNEGCNTKFTPKTHNQKYCTDECCRLATNRRIMRNYYKDKDIRSGAVRFCSVCRATKLSRYNYSDMCAPCAQQKEMNAHLSVRNMLTDMFPSS